MKCLRCGNEMKHYKFNRDFGIYGKEYNPGYHLAMRQDPHNPHSIYECESCGYMELSTKDCEVEDIQIYTNRQSSMVGIFLRKNEV